MTPFGGRPGGSITRARARTGDLPGIVLFVDGILLMLIGTVQIGFELLSHYHAAGPLADRFHGAPYTIGFVEAHGLAAVLGLLLARSANGADRRFWHLLAAAIHLLLGGANVLFWDSFVTFDMVAPGAVATGAQALFVVVHLACAQVPRGSFFRHALLLRPVLVATFAAGLGLHGLALGFGRPWLLEHVLTPAVDSALVIPMAYSAAAGWALRHRVVHPSAWHRRGYLMVLGYLGISVPVHLDSLLTWEVRYVAAFPEWYGLVIIPVQALLLAYAYRLRVAVGPDRLGHLEQDDLATEARSRTPPVVDAPRAVRSRG